MESLIFESSDHGIKITIIAILFMFIGAMYKYFQHVIQTYRNDVNALRTIIREKDELLEKKSQNVWKVTDTLREFTASIGQVQLTMETSANSTVGKIENSKDEARNFVREQHILTRRAITAKIDEDGSI